jgi:hypothetical protein
MKAKSPDRGFLLFGGECGLASLIPEWGGLKPESMPVLCTFHFCFLFQKTKMLRNSGALIRVWRRERDSNPRYRCQYDSLANCSFRPLRHLSERAVKVKRPAVFQKEILFLQKIIPGHPGFFDVQACNKNIIT